MRFLPRFCSIYEFSREPLLLIGKAIRTKVIRSVPHYTALHCPDSFTNQTSHIIDAQEAGLKCWIYGLAIKIYGNENKQFSLSSKNKWREVLSSI